jgi:hypothetical protein
MTIQIKFNDLDLIDMMINTTTHIPSVRPP